MTTTELIELLKKYECGGATGRPREVMFEVGDRFIHTDGIEVTGSGDGLITELYLSLPSVTSLCPDGFDDGYEQGQKDAQQDLDEWCADCKEYDSERHCCPRFNRVIREAVEEVKEERVYCKDCKHRDTDDCPMRFVETVWYDDDEYEDFDEIVTDNTTDDGFCNYGEGRQNE